MVCTVGIYLFDGMEVLDFAGPFEVFTTAARVSARLHPDASPPFRVCSVSRQGGEVRARAGLRVLADHGFASHPTLDLLVVPGGVVDAELEQGPVTDWITACAARAAITASVCTGAFLLARAGLLDGLSATTHWEDIEDLRTRFPGLRVEEGVRWVDHGRIVTSAGIAAGIGMSLHLVERIAGRELARRTALQMEFDWTP